MTPGRAPVCSVTLAASGYSTSAAAAATTPPTSPATTTPTSTPSTSRPPSTSALLQYANVPGVRFLLGDAVDHLRRCEPYGLVYSVHGLGYLHPHHSLPALHRGLHPGGRLVFSVLHTDLHRRPPSSSLEPRHLTVQLKGLEPQDVHLWVC